MTDAEQIQVTRTIDVSTKTLFDFLTLPDRHKEFDGSGMVVSADNTERIQKVGDTFAMNMHAESMGGDYRMVNHVTGFVPNQLVSWQPGQEAKGGEPGGWEWTYELEPQGSDSTEVTLTYDWSKVEDPQLKSIFPKVSKEEMEESLNLLASAVAGE